MRARTAELRLSDLVSHTMTRARAREAADALGQRARQLGASRVYLDMTSSSPVTVSFIDELVQQASRMECEGGPEVVFVITSDRMLSDFQRSVDWRKLACYCQVSGKHNHRVLRPRDLSIAEPEVRAGSKAGLKSVNEANTE